MNSAPLSLCLYEVPEAGKNAVRLLVGGAFFSLRHHQRLQGYWPIYLRLQNDRGLGLLDPGNLTQAF